jgi:UDP-N-acetylmuramate: L-alanyl-gamma-D-glutamyl-meso-diaminopimelate ligase
VVEGIRAAGGEAVFIADVEGIVRHLVDFTRPGDSVAILSNGGFGGIHARLLHALESAARR